MLSRIWSAYLFICLISTPAYSQSSAWSSGGPFEGERLTCLAVSPDNPDILFAGGSDGLYQSTDGGATWVERRPDKVWSIAISASNPDYIYAGGYRFVDRSEDGGFTWARQTGVFTQVNALAVHPTNPEIVYVGAGLYGRAGGSEVAGVFKSEDGGVSWVLKTDDDIDAVLSLMLDPSNPEHVYVGAAYDFMVPSFNHKLFHRSTDGGETWEKFFKVNSSVAINTLAMTPAGIQTPAMYAMLVQQGLYKSVDFGETWSRIKTQSGFPNESGLISVDPSNPDIVYTSYGNSFYRSLNGGASWSQALTALPVDPKCDPSGMFVRPVTGDITMTCRGGQGVFRSSDQADSWTSIGQVQRAADIQYLAVHPDDAHRIYAVLPGNDGKVTISADGGASWSISEESPDDLGAIAIDPQVPSSVWVGRGYDWQTLFYVHNSQDSGNTWTAHRFAESVGGTSTMEVTDILIHPDNSDYILVGTNYLNYQGIHGTGIIVRSLDGGINWSTVGGASSTMALDPGDPNTIYNAKKSSSQMFRTTNIWGSRQVQQITPSGTGDINDIEVDMQSNVYVAANGGLWKRVGNDWTTLTSLPSGSVKALAIDHAASPGIVYAGTGSDGVFVSEDGGATWTDFNDGRVFPTVHKLVLSEGYLFAGSEDGVWKREAISTGLAVPETPALVSPEPGATGLPTDFTLTWSQAARADEYQIQISRNADFTDLFVDQGGILTTTFNISGLQLGTTYYCRVRAQNSAGPGPWSATGVFSISGVATESASELPTEYRLFQNYPNPFNPLTTIVYEVPMTSRVSVTIHDTLGRLVSTLVDRIVVAGVHQVVFSGRDLPSGTYLYRMNTPNGTLSRTMLLLK